MTGLCGLHMPITDTIVCGCEQISREAFNWGMLTGFIMIGLIIFVFYVVSKK